MPFCAYIYHGHFAAPRHIRRLAEGLEAVERGTCGRLIVAMPPRHGKSMTASETFPAWYLGRNPERYVIAAAYGQELADRVARKVRNLMRREDTLALFPRAALADDSTSIRRFAMRAGGEYFAVGIGGPATGRGAHLLLIDDPIKNREDADSVTLRRTLKDWYASVAYTRLMPGGAVVVIATRWHEDDLTGWLLRDHAHENWRVLEMPAIDEDGAALWPEAYPVQRLREIERTLGSREWSALYQQRPAPAAGLLFQPERIGIVEALPAGLRLARGWDMAATEAMGSNDPDWTVGALMGADAQGVFYIAGITRLRGGPLAVEEAILTAAAVDGRDVPVSLPQDPGQAGKMQAGYLVRRLAGFRASATPESGAKTTRALPLAAQVEAGNVRMLRAEWNRALLDEMATFPAGLHDDQVDALGRAFDLLTQGFAARGAPMVAAVNVVGESYWR
ncbi:MAG: phage terminase large subunit [Alphaproteobacteria bacterium]|nr:phage terminase large subunit [Alphaproteobacteria bacterium]